ncbi:MAG: pyridoxal-phosphate dependent enzyme [Longimicrobiales bacterium]
MISIDEIRDAAEFLRGRIHRTPLLSARSIGDRAGVKLWLKPENLQRTGSFKVRGVLNCIRQMSDDQKARGLVTISAGNHAQAVAWAAAAEGVAATVVMPENASPAKVEASRGYGANVVLHGDMFGAFKRMEDLRDEHGYTLLHPFDDPAVMAGQGTVGLEICEDLPDVDVLVVGIGGGGLISGIATAMRALRPGVRIVGVEPFGAAAMTEAMRAGEPVRLERIDTIADGLSAPAASARTLEHVRALVDDVVLVDDAAITNAMHALLERAKLLAEPAGAAATAAVLAGVAGCRPGDRVVCVVSGGNIDLQRMRTLLDGAAS